MFFGSKGSRNIIVVITVGHIIGTSHGGSVRHVGFFAIRIIIIIITNGRSRIARKIRSKIDGPGTGIRRPRRSLSHAFKRIGGSLVGDGTVRNFHEFRPPRTVLFAVKCCLCCYMMMMMVFMLLRSSSSGSSSLMQQKAVRTCDKEVQEHHCDF